MDFVPFTPITVWQASFYLAGMLLFITAVPAFFIARKEMAGQRRKLVSGVSLLLAVGSAATMLAVTTDSSVRIQERLSTVAEAATDMYGVQVSIQTLRKLGYPSHRPGSEFEVVGTARNADGEPLALVWSGDEFLLGAVDGERFREFERVRG